MLSKKAFYVYQDKLYTWYFGEDLGPISAPIVSDLASRSVLDIARETVKHTQDYMVLSGASISTDTLVHMGIVDPTYKKSLSREEFEFIVEQHRKRTTIVLYKN